MWYPGPLEQLSCHLFFVPVPVLQRSGTREWTAVPPLACGVLSSSSVPPPLPFLLRTSLGGREGLEPGLPVSAVVETFISSQGFQPPKPCHVAIARGRSC